MPEWILWISTWSLMFPDGLGIFPRISPLMYMLRQVRQSISESREYCLLRAAGNPASVYGHIDQRPPSDETLSPPNLRLISQWMDHCGREHIQCSQHKLPADGSQYPCLQVMNGRSGNYVALSHCWDIIVFCSRKNYSHP